MKNQLSILASFFALYTFAQQPAVTDTARRRQPPLVGTITPTRETSVHDPVMIRQNNIYYLFCTGSGVSVFSSKDMQQWRREKSVFAQTPSWVTKTLSNYRGSSMWAPDISFHNGQYYLFYSVSAFGKNTSCIGLAVNKTLDSASSDFKWIDMGKIVQSVPGRDLWNAIDPNLVWDQNKTPWLCFGSFWEGMKMVKLNNDLLAIAEPQQWHTIARRPRGFNTADTSAGNAALEGPFVFQKGGYYYLFVSRDYCCRGERSDYKVVVGRSEKATGPFLDKNGSRMDNNGGSLIVQGNKDWYGAGHNSVYTFDGKDYNIFHGYDAKDRGRPKLIIKELQWDKERWPVFEELN